MRWQDDEFTTGAIATKWSERANEGSKPIKKLYVSAVGKLHSIVQREKRTEMKSFMIFIAFEWIFNGMRNEKLWQIVFLSSFLEMEGQSKIM